MRMNHTEVIETVSGATGVDRDTCNIVVKAFEKQAEQGLIDRVRGIKLTAEEKLDDIAVRSGVDRDICNQVVGALEEVLRRGPRSRRGE